MDYETINTLRAHVRKILSQIKEGEMKMKMNGDDELISAVKALIKDIESMSCVPDASGPDSGYWYGEFGEYEDNFNSGEVIVEWPNLAIGVERIKKILDKVASQ
jgi:hypothetical protein